MTVFLLANEHAVELLDTPAELLIGGGDTHGSAHHRGLSFEQPKVGCQCDGQHKEAFGLPAAAEVTVREDYGEATRPRTWNRKHRVPHIIVASAWRRLTLDASAEAGIHVRYE
jgi:hypothetical protein